MQKNSSGKTETDRPHIGSIGPDGRLSYVLECTNCHMSFKPELKQHELGDIEDDKAIVKHFIVCTHCETEYVVHYISNHVRDLQAKLQSTRKQSDHAAFKEALDALQMRMKDRGYPVNAFFK